MTQRAEALLSQAFKLVKAGGNNNHAQRLPGAARAPEPLGADAFHGLAGEIVRTIAPETEADEAALLSQFLLAFGSMAGRCAYFRVCGDEHHLNLFCVLVGRTSKGRKGSALGAVGVILRRVDDVWWATCKTTGLSSGEGLIDAVSDPSEKQTKDGQITIGGVTDKRLFVIEPEFARVLKASGRDHSTLSPIIREAFDSGQLQIMTRSPVRATDAHITIVSHISKQELLKYLTDTEAANGFANRFMWFYVVRSACISSGGKLHQMKFDSVVRRLSQALQFARTVGELHRDEEAEALWDKVYPQLSSWGPYERFGLFGDLTNRAEAITLRLSCIYALLDESSLVKKEHLLAALAVWKYSEDSARFIFGDALADGTADALLRALRAAPEGLTRTDLMHMFARNKPSHELARGLAVLATQNLARYETEETDGRPVERWFAEA